MLCHIAQGAFESSLLCATCSSLKEGWRLPEDRLLKRDDHGYDEVIETASNFLGIREARCLDMCLERMVDKGEAVLQYLCEHAKDVMSPELTRWVDVVLARYVIAPEARLKALTSDVTTADVKFYLSKDQTVTKVMFMPICEYTIRSKP